MDLRLKNALPTLQHGTQVNINGRYYTAGSVVGYAQYCGEDPYEWVVRNQKNRAENGGGYPAHWLNQNAIVICDSPRLRERDARERANAVKVNFGDWVIFDGAILKIIKAPNDNAKFEPVNQEAINLRLMKIEEFV